MPGKKQIIKAAIALAVVVYIVSFLAALAALEIWSLIR
jgi:hypothetical protein